MRLLTEIALFLLSVAIAYAGAMATDVVTVGVGLGFTVLAVASQRGWIGARH